MIRKRDEMQSLRRWGFRGTVLFYLVGSVPVLVRPNVLDSAVTWLEFKICYFLVLLTLTLLILNSLLAVTVYQDLIPLPLHVQTC